MRFSVSLLSVFIGCISLFPARAAAQGPPPEFMSWLPISAEEKATRAPVVEKDAGAEVLLWRVHVLDEFLGSDLRRVAYHYVRLKIFDEKGVKRAATIDIPYREPGNVLEVAGRTIKADGTVVELDKKTVFRRDLVRVGRQAEKSASFAMPAVEPMAIVEYRWAQTEDDNAFRYLQLHFQREFPVRKVTYFVRPLPPKYLTNGDQMYLLPFNCKPTPIQTEREYGFTGVENIPAAHDEVLSPSLPNREPWALLYYRTSEKNDAKKFWMAQGKELYREVHDAVKPNGDLKEAAATATKGATDPDGKIAGIVAWMHKNLRDVYDSDTTAAERMAFFQKLPKERKRTSAEILRSGLGTPNERNVVFIALAGEAGIEARPALVASRLEVEFSPGGTPDRYFLDNAAAAFRVGDKWRVTDVNRQNLAPGTLPWDEEGQAALIGDPKEPEFVDTGFSSPESSSENRVAHLKLSAEGALEGDVEETVAGHRAEEERGAAGGQSKAKWEDEVRDRVQRMFPDSAVSEIEVANADDAAQPLRTRYHVSAPHYAQVTGRRILFQSMPFRRAQGTIFTAAERVNPIEFPFAWREFDEIHIQLPLGFELDNPTAGGLLDLGATGGYSARLVFTKGAQTEITATREFKFGNGGRLKYPVQSYGPLKHGFDAIHTADEHTLSVISK